MGEVNRLERALHVCLLKMVKRFQEKNHRIMGGERWKWFLGLSVSMIL